MNPGFSFGGSLKLIICHWSEIEHTLSSSNRRTTFPEAPPLGKDFSAYQSWAVLPSLIHGFLLLSDSVMAMLRELGRGYLALCSYNCREAINILSSLPPQHYNTGWVLTHIGRAYFELAEYTQVTPRWWLLPNLCFVSDQIMRCFVCAGRASLQWGPQDRVVQSWRNGDLFHHSVAPAEGCCPVGSVERPDWHGQGLSSGKRMTFASRWTDL